MSGTPDEPRPEAGRGQKLVMGLALVLVVVAIIGSIFAAVAFMSQNV
jgi:hypothetical protein